MRKQRSKDNLRALIVKNIAKADGVTPAYVYMVTDGTREDDEMLLKYMDLQESIKELFENKLLKSVTDLVPFEKSQQ